MSKLQFIILLLLALVILLVLVNPSEAEHRQTIRRVIGNEISSTNSLMQRVKRTWAAGMDYNAMYHNYRLFSTTYNSERLVTIGVAGLVFPITPSEPKKDVQH